MWRSSMVSTRQSTLHNYKPVRVISAGSGKHSLDIRQIQRTGTPFFQSVSNMMIELCTHVCFLSSANKARSSIDFNICIKLIKINKYCVWYRLMIRSSRQTKNTFYMYNKDTRYHFPQRSFCFFTLFYIFFYFLLSTFLSANILIKFHHATHGWIQLKQGKFTTAHYLAAEL